MDLATKAVAYELLPFGFQAKRPDLAGQNVEFKALPVEIKADKSKRRVEGWAAGYGNVDNGGDLIDKGAGDWTIKTHLPQKLIKYFWQHEFGIGIPLELKEEDAGLFIAAEITDARDFDKYLAQIEHGVAAHQSIGYSVLEKERRVIPPDGANQKPRQVRAIKRYRLFEVSAVYWPMNEMAEITGTKTVGGKKSLCDLSDVLHALQHVRWMLSQGSILTPEELDLARQLLEVLGGASGELSIIVGAAPVTERQVDMVAEVANEEPPAEDYTKRYEPLILAAADVVTSWVKGSGVNRAPLATALREIERYPDVEAPKFDSTVLAALCDTAGQLTQLANALRS